MLIYRAPKGVKGLPAVRLEGLPVVFLEDLSAVFMAEYFRLKELLRRGIQISHYS